MKKVLCSHQMNTTKFVCKNPDEGDGSRFYVPVIVGQPVMVDERIVEANPTTFTIIPQESASDADDVDVKDDDDTGADDIESLDGAALNEDVTDDADPVKNDAENEDEKFVEPDITEDLVPGPEADVIEDNESTGPEDVADIIENINDDEAKAHAEAELLTTIEGFKSRKKLDAWAAGLGIKLDGRKSLSTMKAKAKEALNLG